MCVAIIKYEFVTSSRLKKHDILFKNEKWHFNNQIRYFLHDA